MKIAMVCFPTPGGSGVVAMELAREMARRGHEMHIVSYERPFRLKEADGIVYHQIPLREFPLFPSPLFTLETVAKLVQILQECSPGIIHVHYTLPYSIAALQARSISGLEHIKLVTTIHGTDISTWGRDKLMQPLIRYGLEKSDAVTAVSHSLRKEAAALLELQESSISVIYNFIDVERYNMQPDPELRSRLAPGGEKIIMHISNFRPVKRVPDLIRAFARLSRERSDIVLVLVGEGAEKAPVEEMVRQLGLISRVRFMGSKVDPAPLLAVADLLALPSEKESFGLVALEAMACGVPVVATNTGGLPEVVKDGEWGFLVPVNDSHALAAAMGRLLDDTLLYRRFAVAARRQARQFATSLIIPEYEELYRRLTPY